MISSVFDAVIFDWAGTLIDFGSRAPMQAFVDSFARFNVDISIAEARQPMGIAKRPHIAALLTHPRIHAAWTNAHGHPPSEADLDAVYADFIPRNMISAAAHAAPIPGAARCLQTLREHGLKIGSTTGYTRAIMETILPHAAKHNVTVDHLVCAEETPSGRPTPLMLWHNLIALNIWPAQRVVKVDDTPIGIAEGLNAGALTVGVAVSGNCFGHSEADIAAMSSDEFTAKRHAAYHALRQAGAHYVIDTIADLPTILSQHAAQHHKTDGAA
ncbi:phosphonoacetaldehyde hydrolase [Neokomagataea tanensis NBRC 106556]|uniref:Phosphonoacetaldehyde hydrolase n=1 Tax=Neokomagataea tanensis NBRC 106556 TaxID=1223519 RepID=A0ABQ0QGA6_9PROT|nr:phosphonoacetaldehyde hydrolase [Neokomagataea tanensis]GBR43718.1 phosphonoacetaldehyde hydrolase [Neokomagataea tanensis NBRC 106556]